MLANWLVHGALSCIIFLSVKCCMKLLSYDLFYSEINSGKRGGGINFDRYG